MYEGMIVFIHTYIYSVIGWCYRIPRDILYTNMYVYINLTRKEKNGTGFPGVF